MHTGFTKRKRAATTALTGVAAAAVTGLFVAVPAGASPVAASTPAAAVRGTEHIQLMTTSGNATSVSIIVWGVFTAAGVDHEGNTIDTVVLPGGTIKVKHPGDGGPGSVNAKTCLFTASERAGYTFVSGTGRYKGISGHGTAVVSIVGVAARVRGACSETAPPVAFHEVINGSGPARLP